MKPVKFSIIIALVLTIPLILFYGGEKARSADGENYCFTCHTNARKLIKITREISKANKDKPGGSAETEGEG